MSKKISKEKNLKQQMNHTLNSLSKMSKDLSADSLKKTAKTAVARALKKASGLSKDEESFSKGTAKSSFYESCSQELVPVKNIINGIIQTYDNKYIGIVELLPINYYEKPNNVKKNILKGYSALFRNDMYKFSIKIMSDTSNQTRLIKSIQKQCLNQDNPKISAILEDYIKYIRFLGSNGSVTKRFFIIYEYLGDAQGKKSSSIEEICQTMYETREHISSIMEGCGNVCVKAVNPNMQTAEILYYYFNRKSSKTTAFEERYERMEDDIHVMNTLSNKKFELLYSDLLAPRGFDTQNRKSIFMDGEYYGYLGVKSESWPESVQAGWIDNLNFGSSVDVDMIFKRLPPEPTKLALKQYNKLTSQRVYETGAKGKVEKNRTASLKLQNNTTVARAMNAGDDLYDCGIFLTIRANTQRQLGMRMRQIQKKLSSMASIETEDSFLCAEDYFKMSMPLLYITSPFNRLKHNILSSNITSMYCYTSYELNDPTGFVLGQNIENNTLVSINNFNTDYYKNANMLLLGTSGAGKTFTEQLMARRMLLNGMRCFFVIPKKGYEYEPGCRAINGVYAKMIPGSKDCINIMAIRPEGTINESVLGDDVVIQQSNSLLTKKINTIIVWLQMLLQNEKITNKMYGLINRILISLYDDFGITVDNRTIYNEDGTLKEMPIIGDMYNAFLEHPELENITAVLETFVTGNFANLNGQTNVDLDNNYVVFDVDEDYISETLHAAILYIAFDHVYSEVRENDLSRDAIFLDEVWKMMATDDSAKQVQNMIKLVRGYGGCTIIATQELEDFINSKNGFGRSVLNNSEIRLVLNLKEEGLDLVKKSLKLTADDEDAILHFKRGFGMLISNGDKVKVHLLPSADELATYTTDVNDRIATAG